MFVTTPRPSWSAASAALAPARTARPNCIVNIDHQSGLSKVNGKDIVVLHGCSQQNENVVDILITSSADTSGCQIADLLGHMDRPNVVHEVELSNGKHVPSFEVEKETGKNDLVYQNMEKGVQEQRLAEADDDGRWPPRHGESKLNLKLW